MENMVEKLRWDDVVDRALVIEKLKQSKVILSTTDTVPGLLAPLTKKGFLALSTIKKRQEKRYLILIADKERISHFVTKKAALRVKSLMAALWPGPLTIILKARSNLPQWLKGSSGTVALRVPNHEGLLAVTEPFEGLFSTSANMTGNPTPVLLNEVDPRIIEQSSAVVVDAVWASANNEGKPSTIIDATGPLIKIVRAGALERSELEKFVSLD